MAVGLQPVNGFFQNGSTPADELSIIAIKQAVFICRREYTAVKDQFNSFIEVIRAFENCNVSYVIIGGVAVILHGLERLTRDIDVFVDPTLENIGRLKKALMSVFSDPAIEEITLDELKKYPVIRYGTPSGFHIDLIVGLGDQVSFENLEFEIIDFDGVPIRIATPDTLYMMKSDSLRPRDQADALFLKELIKERQSGSYHKEPGDKQDADFQV
jgi:hypothetical protein